MIVAPDRQWYLYYFCENKTRVGIACGCVEKLSKMTPVSNLYSWIILVSIPLMVLAQTTNNDQCLVNKEVVVSDADVSISSTCTLFCDVNKDARAVLDFVCSVSVKSCICLY